MYCRKCNNLMPDDEIKCPKCGFDNTKDFDYTTENIEANGLRNKRKKELLLYLFMVLILVISIPISIYNFKGIKEETMVDVEDGKNLEKNSFEDEFTFYNIKVDYPSGEYGTSTNTIFYKNNNNYKIEFKHLSEKEYSKLINDFILESKLGNIPTKINVGNNEYTHIFILNNQYYSIKVCYDEHDTSDNIEYQLELTKIINTLREKNAI